MSEAVLFQRRRFKSSMENVLQAIVFCSDALRQIIMTNGGEWIRTKRIRKNALEDIK